MNANRDKALLRGSIATLQGGNQAVAQGNLASLLKDEGKLDEAMATYEAVYPTFAALDARQQMAAVLNMQSQVLTDMGRYQEAIAKQEASLKMNFEDGNEEGQVSNLHQLSILYWLTEDYAAALARNQEAETLARKMGNEPLVAATLYQQGLIYNNVASVADNNDEAAGYVRQAFDRFQQRLSIARRIGDEAGASDSLVALGMLLRNADQMRMAIAAFTEALDISQRLNNLVDVGITLDLLGSVHERQGQHAATLEKFEQALQLFRQYGSPQQIAVEEQQIARVRTKMGGA